MKKVVILSGLLFFSLSVDAQERVKLNKTLKTTKETTKKLPTAPPPKVNNATESNRKRPGGTLPNNSNSKQAPPSGTGTKKGTKK